MGRRPFPARTWAIESAGGLGCLLAQQLVAAGEDVVDVPATLASRVRVLASGRSNENDPSDARAVAVAALRTPALRSVAADSAFRAPPCAVPLAFLAVAQFTFFVSTREYCHRSRGDVDPMDPGSPSRFPRRVRAEPHGEAPGPVTGPPSGIRRYGVDYLRIDDPMQIEEMERGLSAAERRGES